jgi:hypothetical protein
MYQAARATEMIVLNQQLRFASSAVLAFLATAACQASQGDLANGSRQAAAANSGNNVTNQQAPINQRFRSLDEYLAYLQLKEAPVDGPWYKEVSPGIYELQTGNLHLDTPGDEKRTFTRQELAEMFGFSK